MANLLEYVYNGKDNTIDVLLKEGGDAVDLSAVTRMVLKDLGGEWTIDYDTAPSAFDWDTGVTGKVIIALGDQSITAGKYWVRLIVYDAVNTNGIVWGNEEDEFVIHVLD